MTNQRWSRLVKKLQKYLLISLLILQTFAGVYAANSPMPEGMKGWWYYINIYSNGYAATPEEACKLTAQNHMKTWLVDMEAVENFTFNCKYPHFLVVGGVRWYGGTTLYCNSGYVPTQEGICVKRREIAQPLNCESGEPGFMVGNPVMVSTGAKVQHEVDTIGMASTNMRIERTYRVFRHTSEEENWSFWFDRTLKFKNLEDDGRPRLIEGARGDGTYFEFQWDRTTKKYLSSTHKSATIEALNSTYTEWLHIQDGIADRYERRSVGDIKHTLLMSSQRLGGGLQNFTYAPDSLQLQEITDEQGRKLVLTWGASKQIASISGPEGSAHYNYDFPWGAYPSLRRSSRLISVDYRDLYNMVLSTRSYHYEDTYHPYLLTGITDENGNRFANYTYDSTGRTVMSEHAGGANRYSFVYPDESKRVITDPLGTARTLKTKYINGVGVVIGESQPGGSGCTPGSTTITHDTRGAITSRTDFNGHKTCYRYNGRGLQSSVVSGLLSSEVCPSSDTTAITTSGVRRISTQWHPPFPLRTVIAESQRITTFLYNGQPDAAGNIAECALGKMLPNNKPLPLLCSVGVQPTTDTNGAKGFTASAIGTARVWRFTYNADGQLLTSVGPYDVSGHTATETRTYYQIAGIAHNAGDLSSVISSTGDVTEYLEYSLSGLPTMLRQPGGQIVTLKYGPGGRLLGVNVDDGSGSIERRDFEYDPVGNLIRSTNPDGSLITYTYDDAHRLTGLADSAGNRKQMDLDGMGNVVQEKYFGRDGALAWKITRSFDALNRLESEQRALQNAGTVFQYDRNGNLTNLIDQMGRVSSSRYDSLDRVVETTLPPPTINDVRPTIGHAYDLQDNVVSVRDPKGFVTGFTVDGFRQRIGLSSPDAGVSSSFFDGAGNLTSSTDARGIVMTYSYDLAGHVTRAGNNKYEYGVTGTTAVGQLTRMFDDSGETTFAYDGLGRVLERSQKTISGSNGPSKPLTSKLEKDGAGAMRVFDVRYMYGPSGANTENVKSITYPSGSRLDISYDSTGRPGSLMLAMAGSSAPVTLMSEISYHPLGPVSGWTWGNSAATAPNTYLRTFDLEGKLVSYPLGSSWVNGQIRTLHYDAAGRISRTSHTGSARSAMLDQRYYYDDLDRLTGFDTASTNVLYRYDVNGNRYETAYGSTSYYSTISTTSNRLITTSGPLPAKKNQFDAAGNLITDGTYSYRYNNQGRMESSTVGNITTYYRYNGLGERVFKASSNQTVYFVYDQQRRLLGEYDANGKVLQETIYLGDLPVAVLVSTASGSELRYVYSDHLSAPPALTRASDNQFVWRWDNADPFGLLQPDENPSGLGAQKYNMRFPGQVYDGETKNYYNYYRDYDPQTGRYIQSDPIGIAGGLNTYGYAGANPASFTDPMGLAVYITGHIAAAPVGKYFPLRTGPAYHMSILYSPDCGDGFGTLGGQPTKGGLGDLVSASNYPGDAPEHAQYMQRVPTPPGQSDADFIMNLNMAAQRHGPGTNYAFPNLISGAIGGGYNSNSYVSGLIIAAGGKPPILRTGGAWVAPGYDHPLPFPWGKNLAHGEKKCGCAK